MCRLLTFRHRKRRADSTIMGGLILLTLILSALGTMVFVTEQYDQYQQIDKQMVQDRNQQLSEDLVINYPGLENLTSGAAGSWGATCVTTYNCFNITVSNLGGVGIQIVRIYINSTGPIGQGCSYNPSASSPHPQPCILNPSGSIASYTFNQANQYINPGEVNHAVAIALPGGSSASAITLPGMIMSTSPPENTFMLVTSRGNVFSFQWPFQVEANPQSQSAFSYANMKLAYQMSTPGVGGVSSSIQKCTGSNTPSGCGYDSQSEGSGGSTFCHSEQLEPLTGITDITSTEVIQDSGTLTFVNPWITNTIFTSAENYSGGSQTPSTQLYIYVDVINTGNFTFSPVAGTIDLTWYSALHVDGAFMGVYWLGKFYTPTSPPSIPDIAPNNEFYAIYHIYLVKLSGWGPGNSASWPSGGYDLPVMFWGSASLTNNQEGGSSAASSFYSASILVAGLWIRYSCSGS